MKPDDGYPTLSALLAEVERSPLARLTLREIIMEIRYQLHEPPPPPVIVVPVFLGETVTFDVAALVGYEIEILSLDDPPRGTHVRTGTIIAYTAPTSGGEGTAVQTGQSRPKLKPPHLAGAA